MDLKKLIKSFLFSKHFLVVFLLIFTQLIIISLLQIFVKMNAYNDSDQLRFALMTFMVSLLFGGFIKIYSFFHFGAILNLHKETSLMTFAALHFSDWIVTEVRAQVRVLLRLFLLIIPGVIEAVRLSFALPSVFLNPNMKDPHYDPIEDSRDKLPLKSPFLIPLFFFTMALPIILFVATNSERVLFETPTNIILGVMASAIQATGVVISFAYVLNLYSNIFTTDQETL
ncbi:MAG: hypothetical protein ACRBBP_04650 [Bdellovibrionales bacterium]